MRRLKKVIGECLKIIVAKTRLREFNFKQLYRRRGLIINMTVLFSFREMPRNVISLAHDEVANCVRAENLALLYHSLHFPKPL